MSEKISLDSSGFVFFFPPFGSFLSEPLWDFMDAVHGCRYSFIRKAFPANYSF